MLFYPLHFLLTCLLLFWQWSTLPNPKVELVGWVPDEEFKNPLATYVANASNIPALKVQPPLKQVPVLSESLL